METPLGYPAQEPWTPFLNFLRGMETVVLPQRVGVEDHFLNFLRGMETRDRWAVRTSPTPFLNFLRGMETRPCCEAVWSP